MSDRDALHAAVRAAPDEDTPRLVLADWLDEHGDPRRAAFIRAKVEQHRLEAADTDAAWVFRYLDGQCPDGVDRIDWARVDPDLAALFAARKAAGKAHVNLTAKTEGTPRLKGVTFQGNVRGFFHSVVVNDGETFLKHAGTIFAAAPITEVMFNSLVEDDARALVRAGHLARIRDLAISEVVEPEALELLGNYRDAAGVRSLTLEASDYAALVADALAAGRHWTGLRRLELTEFADADEAMEDDQAARLFRRPAFAGLREVVAWNSGLGDAAARAIAALPEVRLLDLGINEITGTGAAALALGKGLAALRYLDLSACDIEDPVAAAALLRSPRLSRLAVLRLSGEGMAVPDPKVLAKPGRGPGLRVLELSGQKLTPAAANALAACPTLHGLWYLSLANCDLNHDSLSAFTRSPGFDPLVMLDLQSNRLDARGAKVIADRPPPALQWLDLFDNPLTPAGLAALAASPHLDRLRFLSVSGSANAAGVKRLKKRLGAGLLRA